jgi:hypothetical protein
MLRVVVLLALVGAAALAQATPSDARLIGNTIGADASLAGHGEVAKGTVLIECTAGEFVQFTLTFTQGAASGTGYGAGRCTGELEMYGVTVPAQHGTFIEGAAEACATAVNRNRGAVEETREWCRAAAVTLSAQ